MVNNISTTSFYNDIRRILQSARNTAYAAVNTAMIDAYWLVGKGFSVANLKNFRQLYLTFAGDKKSYTLCSQLSWSHIRLIMRIENKQARTWYLTECKTENWSVRQLQRHINSSYYERLLSSADKKQAIVSDGENERVNTRDFVKDPYVLEFLDLETSKLTHQDIGQMDMYVRMFDDLKRGGDDNPTMGIIRCNDKEETVVRYSVLKDSEQLFASKYRLVLPTEKELEAELEREIRLIEAREAGE